MAKRKAYRKRTPRKKKRVTHKKKKKVTYKKKCVSHKKSRKTSKGVQKGGSLASALSNVNLNPMLWFTDKMVKYGMPADRRKE